MNLKEGSRTYSYMVSGIVPGLDASSFPLKDSAGNDLNCNYLKVDLYYTNEQQKDAICIAYIEPFGLGTTNQSILNHVNIAEEYTTDDVAAGNVSGIFGEVIVARPDGINKGTAIFKCDNQQIISSVNVHLHEDFSTRGLIKMVFTYGSILYFNQLRQPLYSRGT